MQNEEIARVLEQVADMLEVRGENFFRVRAYRNAARAVSDHLASVAELDRKALQKSPGVGADLAEKITSLIATGDFPPYHELVAQVPPGLLELLMLPGFGPKRVKLLAERLGVRDRASLRQSHRVGTVADTARLWAENRAAHPPGAPATRGAGANALPRGGGFHG